MKPMPARRIPTGFAAFAAALGGTMLALAALPAAAAPTVGEAAPAFTLTDSHGQPRSLADFKGKTVVLEWTNNECPFVRKHYNSGNIPGQQKAATGAGIVWLVINSSAPGKQGHVDGARAEKIQADWKASQTAYLFDADGKVGHAYAAKTTPNMYVIDAAGKLRYAGAIDSIPSADQADLAKATQYVKAALADLAANRPVGTPLTQPYGCSIKYAD